MNRAMEGAHGMHGQPLVPASPRWLIGGGQYVREVPNATAYNLTFLAVGGVLFILLGWLLMRAGGGIGGEARR